MGGPSWPAYGFFRGTCTLPRTTSLLCPLGSATWWTCRPSAWYEILPRNTSGKTRRANKKGFHHPLFFLKEMKIEGLPKIRLAGRICCFFWKILVFTSCVEKLLSKVYQDWCWENFVRYHQVSWGFYLKMSRQCRKIWLQSSTNRWVDWLAKWWSSSFLSNVDFDKTWMEKTTLHLVQLSRKPKWKPNVEAAVSWKLQPRILKLGSNKLSSLPDTLCNLKGLLYLACMVAVVQGF